MREFEKKKKKKIREFEKSEEKNQGKIVEFADWYNFWYNFYIGKNIIN